MNQQSLQHQIASWSREMFGSDTNQVMIKLEDEYQELDVAVYEGDLSDESRSAIAKEAADVLFMLFQLAENFEFDLLEETRKKFEVNKARKWERQPNGTFQHVKGG